MQILFKSLFMATLLSSCLSAHFQVILPESDSIGHNKRSQLLSFMFMHPFEQTYMNMKKPKKALVYNSGKSQSLTLKEKKVDSFSTWESEYEFKRPGDYIFYVEPEPYYEPSEEKFIKHLTKTTINAYGLENGWDEALGVKAEIVPLTRPYGLWQGNSFSGVVLFKGEKVPFAEIEVEYFNKNSIVNAPTSAHITQIMKADENGVFTYTIPFAGFWGFAALLEDDKTIKKGGREYPVELGAVLWLEAYKAK